MKNDLPPAKKRPSGRRQLGYALVVGVLVGLLSAVYMPLVRYTQGLSLLLGRWGHTIWYGWIVIPVVSGLLGFWAAWLADKFSPEASGGGLVHIKGTLLGVKKLEPLRLIPIKLIGSLSIFIGGIAVGPEAPSVQMGGAVGQLVGSIFKLEKTDTRPLIAAGAGAGFAAVFNAPLAGFIYVLEELRKELSSVTYGTALIAAISADFIIRIFFPGYSYFVVPHSGGLPLSTLPVALVIGLAGGIMGYVFKRLVLSAQDLRKKFKLKKQTIGAIAGIVMGFVLITLPALSGSGQNSVNELFKNNGAGMHLEWFIGAYLLLSFGRMFVTVLCHNAEMPGGILVPILAFGAYLGIFITQIAIKVDPIYQQYLIGLVTLGMASTLASSIRAPLTCTVLVVEVTGEYGLLYALLVATFAAYAVGEWFHDEPLDDYLLERDLQNTTKKVNERMSITDIELTVEPGSKMDGAAIREIQMPRHALILKVSRGDRVFLPNGSTILEEGDVIQVAVDAAFPNDALSIEALTSGL